VAETRFKLAGKTYTTASLDSVSLKDLLVWQRECADLGLSIPWAQVEANAVAMSEGDAEANLADVDQLLMLAVTIWASRRAAGEDLTFAEAIDFPLTELEFLPQPQDHAPKAASKKQPRKGSAAGGSAPAAARS
jgi:hypothetical protein